MQLKAASESPEEESGRTVVNLASALQVAVEEDEDEP